MNKLPSRWLTFSLLGILILIAVVVRVRLLDLPLERDEGEYAYSGQLILEGIPPYKLASNMKMPGTYLAYAALMAVFGQTPSGIHLGLLLVHLATLVVLFKVAHKFCSLDGAVITTSAYALMTLSTAYYGLAAHATHFIVLFALAGSWLLLREEKPCRLGICLVSGVCFGMAFLMKQPGVFLGMFGGLFLAWKSLSEKRRWSQLFAQLVLYSVGCLLPFFAVCVWLNTAGVFPQFWFWTITYAREYVDLMPLQGGIELAKIAFGKAIGAAPMLWVMAGAGLAGLFFSKATTSARVFLVGFLLFLFLAVCPGLYFREHYLIVLLPAVALLTGLAVSWGGQRLANSKLFYLPVVLGAFACLQSLQADREVLFRLKPNEACAKIYNGNPFVESLEIGKYIEQHTRKDQRIVVIGSEPQINFYARRHSSTSQIYMYPLVESQPLAQKMQEDMIRDIESNPPAYLVFVSLPASWLVSPNASTTLLDWIRGYVKNLKPACLIKYTSEGSSSSRAETAPVTLGEDFNAVPEDCKLFMLLLKRPDNL